MSDLLKVDIGGGSQSVPGCINLDPVHGRGIWRRQAQAGIPVDDGTVQTVYASHVLEHIPTADRIGVFNEVWRVLSGTGRFDVHVPLLMNAGQVPQWRAVADPTHVSFWVAESFGYFDGTITYDADYGIRPWRTIGFNIAGGWEAHWVGVPIK